MHNNYEYLLFCIRLNNNHPKTSGLMSGINKHYVIRKKSLQG